VCNGLEYVWSHGGDVLDPEDPTKVIIDSAESAAGLATERSMVATGTSPKAVYQYQESETAGAFLTGTAVFMRIWPSTYALAGWRRLVSTAPGGALSATLPSVAFSQQGCGFTLPHERTAACEGWVPSLPHQHETSP
jgi:multiple sugar transport system substrate-binding protein